MKKVYKVIALLIFAMSAFALFGCGKDFNLRVATKEYNLVEGEREQIEASVENYDGEVAFTYSSSDESVAAVENGYIVALKGGTAEITVGASVDGENIFSVIKVNVTEVYKVEFAVDGVVISGKDYKQGETIILPDEPVKDADVRYTYTFDGWQGYTAGMTASADVKFDAMWQEKLNEYKVRFLSDGELFHETTLPYGTLISAPEATPEKQSEMYDYAFVGWEGLTESTTVIGNMEFEAQFTPSIKRFNVTFVVDGKTYYQKEYSYGSTIVLPEPPYKDKTAQYTYVFTGWSGYTENMTVTKEETFVADFSETVNNYYIKFTSEGKVVSYESYPYGGTIVPPATPSKENTAQYTYTFSGWQGYTEGDTVSGEKEFAAIWNRTVNTYDVTFMNEGSLFGTKEDVPYGTAIESILIDVPKKEGYTYKWVYDGETVTGNLTVTSLGEINVYDVQFVVDGKVYHSYSAEYGSAVTLPEAPVKETTATTIYDFKEWTGYQENMTVTNKLTFTAVFSESERSYTVNYIVNGEDYRTDTYGYGDLIILPQTPDNYETESAYYKFSHWDGYDDGMTVSGDETIEAVFTRVIKTFTVLFVSDGTEYAEREVEYGATMSVPDPVKQPEGNVLWQFSHWQDEYGNEFIADAPVVSNMTLTAVFDKAYLTSGSVTLPSSAFGENYGVYADITNTVIDIDGTTAVVDETGSFTLTLKEGEHVLTAELKGFLPVTRSLAVTENSLDWGSVEFKHVDVEYNYGSMSYVDGVLSPALGNSVYQTIIFDPVTDSDYIAVRYTVNPTSLYFTQNDQIGFYIESTENPTVNLLFAISETGKQINFFPNKDFFKRKTVNFPDGAANIKFMDAPYTLAFVINRSGGSYVLSVFVNDVMILTADLASSTLFGADSPLLPAGTIRAGAAVHYSNNRYTTDVPFTLTGLDYSFSEAAITEYMTPETFTVSGVVAYPESNIFGESFSDYYALSDVTVTADGIPVTVGEDGTFSFDARSGSVNVVVSAPDFQPVEAVATVSDAPLDLGTITLRHRELNLSNGGMSQTDGIITPAVGNSTTYQTATFDKLMTQDTLVIRETILIKDSYMQNSEQIGFYMSCGNVNLSILVYDNNLRTLINKNWSFVKNITFDDTSLNIKKGSAFMAGKTQFDLTLVAVRNAENKTFVLSIYIDDALAITTDIASVTASAGNYIDYLPFTGDITFGAMVNYSNGKYTEETGAPIAFTDIDYSFAAFPLPAPR